MLLLTVAYQNHIWSRSLWCFTSDKPAANHLQACQWLWQLERKAASKSWHVLRWPRFGPLNLNLCWILADGSINNLLGAKPLNLKRNVKWFGMLMTSMYKEVCSRVGRLYIQTIFVLIIHQKTSSNRLILIIYACSPPPPISNLVRPMVELFSWSWLSIWP